MQRLQLPCGRPGQALPPGTLLPFLAAVDQCCSRDARQPGTLLSHCRCRWTGPRGAGGARTASRLGARAKQHGPLLPRSRHPLGTRAPRPGPQLAVALLGVPPRPPGPGPQVPLQLKVNCSKGAAQLGTFLALEQLLQQAGAEGSVDIFTVVLQQSQACSLMTPTLVSSPRAQPRDMGVGGVRPRPSGALLSVGAVQSSLSSPRPPACPQEQYAHLYSCLNSVLADRLP